MDEKQFLETWDIHNRINLYLLDATEPTALGSLSASKGRSVGEQFAAICTAVFPGLIIEPL